VPLSRSFWLFNQVALAEDASTPDANRWAALCRRRI
jgi:hypothetical protein